MRAALTLVTRGGLCATAEPKKTNANVTAAQPRMIVASAVEIVISL
jgi:hypothetical protein